MTSVTQETFKEAIEETRGTLTAIANHIGVHFITVWRFSIKDENKEFCDNLLRLAKRRNVSRASDTIYEYSTMDDEGDTKIMALKLKASEKIVMTQGKDDGWVEKQITQHEGKIDNKMEVEIIEIHKKEDED